MRLGIWRRYCFSSFHSISAKLDDKYPGNGEHWLYHFFKFKICYFEILTWESMGNHKVWKVLSMANRRAKRTKIWISGYYGVYIRYVFVKLVEVILRSVYALCKIPHVKIFKHHSSHSSKLISFMRTLETMEVKAITLIGDLALIKKSMGPWIF